MVSRFGSIRKGDADGKRRRREPPPTIHNVTDLVRQVESMKTEIVRLESRLAATESEVAERDAVIEDLRRQVTEATVAAASRAVAKKKSADDRGAGAADK